MEAAVARVSLAGQVIKFERATLVDFMGWRLVLSGAAVREEGAETEVAVELTVSGERLLGTVRTNAHPDGAAKPKPGDRTVLRGIGALRRWGEAARAG